MRIVNFNADHAEWIGDHQDGCYIQTGQHPHLRNQWFCTIVVDSETGSFVDDLHTDAGPFDTEQEAMDYGVSLAIGWCSENRVSYCVPEHIDPLVRAVEESRNA
jgi:hypothetical protein